MLPVDVLVRAELRFGLSVIITPDDRARILLLSTTVGTLRLVRITVLLTSDRLAIPLDLLTPHVVTLVDILLLSIGRNLLTFLHPLLMLKSVLTLRLVREQLHIPFVTAMRSLAIEQIFPLRLAQVSLNRHTLLALRVVAYILLFIGFRIAVATRLTFLELLF